ncbi:MAG: metalloregulator ArsR/SmtB family transcription factor [Pseudomonadales bacterium]|nr:metalloregulator ArsR/SmtB family transcription factor [Pseudomonadales bacterium]
MVNYLDPIHRTFHALADPTRLAMFEKLCGGPAPVSELAEDLPVSLPAVLKHLAVLEADGIVVSRKVGRVRTCRIQPGALQQADEWITQRRVAWERSLDRLGNWLEADNFRAEQEKQK